MAKKITWWLLFEAGPRGSKNLARSPEPIGS
jgi:hypothetical protein